MRRGCPWCVFTVEEPTPVMTFDGTGDGITVHTTQRLWQPVVYAHVRGVHPEHYDKLPDLGAVLAEHRDLMNRALSFAVDSIGMPR